MTLKRSLLPLHIAGVLLLLNWCASSQPPAVPTAPSVTLDAAQLFAYDKSLPLTPDEQLTSDQPTVKAYKVTYTSTNNQRVPALFQMPAVKEGERVPCILLMHGLGQNKASFALFLGTFIKAGYAVFAIDAQYHGDRKPPYPLELFGKDVYATRELLLQTAVDLRRAVDYLQTRKEIDPKRISYLGFSMGGILGSIVCGVDDRIQSPILALAGGNWKVMGETSKLPAAENARKAFAAGAPNMVSVLEPLDPVRWVGQISPRPVLFINGNADTVVPVAAGKALQEAAGPGKEVFIYKGDHVPQGIELTRVLGRISSWLDAHLKKPNGVAIP
jgi:uncharacterized protein